MGCSMRIKFQKKRLKLRVSRNRLKRLKRKLRNRLKLLRNRKNKKVLNKRRLNQIPRRRQQKKRLRKKKSKLSSNNRSNRLLHKTNKSRQVCFRAKETSLFLAIFSIITKIQFSRHRTKLSLFLTKLNSNPFLPLKIKPLYRTINQAKASLFSFLNKKLQKNQPKKMVILKKKLRLMSQKLKKNLKKLNKNLTSQSSLLQKSTISNSTKMTLFQTELSLLSNTKTSLFIS